MLSDYSTCAAAIAAPFMSLLFVVGAGTLFRVAVVLLRGVAH